ncbi:hypothetical protein ACU4GD_44595 [Cupriavidus basilensis]
MVRWPASAPLIGVYGIGALGGNCGCIAGGGGAAASAAPAAESGKRTRRKSSPWRGAVALPLGGAARWCRSPGLSLSAAGPLPCGCCGSNVAQGHQKFEAGVQRSIEASSSPRPWSPAAPADLDGLFTPEAAVPVILRDLPVDIAAIAVRDFTVAQHWHRPCWLAPPGRIHAVDFTNAASSAWSPLTERLYRYNGAPPPGAVRQFRPPGFPLVRGHDENACSGTSAAADWTKPAACRCAAS